MSGPHSVIFIRLRLCAAHYLGLVVELLEKTCRMPLLCSYASNTPPYLLIKTQRTKKNPPPLQKHSSHVCLRSADSCAMARLLHANPKRVRGRLCLEQLSRNRGAFQRHRWNCHERSLTRRPAVGNPAGFAERLLRSVTPRVGRPPGELAWC